MRLLVPFLFFMVLAIEADAQGPIADEAFPPSLVEKPFDRDRWHELTDPLGYDGKERREKAPREPSLREGASGRSKPGNPSSPSWFAVEWLARPWVSALSRIILIGLGATLLFFLIRALWGETLNRNKKPRVKKTSGNDLYGIDLKQVEEDPDNFDLQALVSKAEQAGNLALAYRLQFLDALKALSAGKRIRRKKGKANHQYLSELWGGPFYETMERQTGLFDKVFYGGFHLGRESYEEAKAAFSALHLQLRGARASKTGRS